jgi:hypothetical protein
MHPKCGASWEGYAIEEVLRTMEPDESYFWSTHGGAELDLLLIKNGRRYSFECKRMDAPRLTPSMRVALEVPRLEHLTVIYPGAKSYPISGSVTAVPLIQMVTGKIDPLSGSSRWHLDRIKLPKACPMRSASLIIPKMRPGRVSPCGYRKARADWCLTPADSSRGRERGPEVGGCTPAATGIAAVQALESVDSILPTGTLGTHCCCSCCQDRSCCGWIRGRSSNCCSRTRPAGPAALPLRNVNCPKICSRSLQVSPWAA